MRHKSGNGHGHGMNIEQFLENIKSVVHSGEELLKSGATDVKERAISGARVTDETVREHPYQSLGIAFGVGVLVGALALGCLMHQQD